MDPNQTLIDADAAIADCEFEHAADLLCAYFAWRMRGGFMPTNGDHLAWSALASIGRNADKWLASSKSATDSLTQLRDSMATALDTIG